MRRPGETTVSEFRVTPAPTGGASAGLRVTIAWRGPGSPDAWVRALAAFGYTLEVAEPASGGRRPDVALIFFDGDVSEPAALLDELRRVVPAVPCVAVSETVGVRAVVEFMRRGGCDYSAADEGVIGVTRCIDRVTALAQRPASVAPPERAVGGGMPGTSGGLPGTSGSFPAVHPANVVSGSTAAARSVPPQRAVDVLSRLAGARGGASLLVKGNPGATKPAAAPLAAQADALPQLDPKLAELREMMARVDVPVADIEAFVVSDPGLVVTVLKTANSAYFRSPRMITNIREACVRIGNRQVFALLMESLLRRSFTAPTGEAREVFEAMWKNAALTARLARRLAQWRDLPRPEDVYVTGLLHNVGEFVLAWRLANNGQGDFGQPLADAVATIEQRHEEVGAHAAQTWGMPPQVQVIAGHHHHPRANEQPQDRDARLTIVACWALARQVSGDYFPNMAEVDATTLFEEMGLSEGLRARIAQECLEAIDGL